MQVDTCGARPSPVHLAQSVFTLHVTRVTTVTTVTTVTPGVAVTTVTLRLL